MSCRPRRATFHMPTWGAEAGRARDQRGRASQPFISNGDPNAFTQKKIRSDGRGENSGEGRGNASYIPQGSRYIVAIIVSHLDAHALRLRSADIPGQPQCTLPKRALKCPPSKCLRVIFPKARIGSFEFCFRGFARINEKTAGTILEFDTLDQSCTHSGYYFE